MIWMVQRGISYWLVLTVALLAALFLARIFIFFHDATHGSFFSKRWANRAIGYVTGILTFTAYDRWRHEHALHHATAGNLDRRGHGDVWMMTVEEYQNASRWKRLAYRVFRYPLVTFGIGPLAMFLVAHRFVSRDARDQDRRSVWITNLAIVAVLVLAHFTIGLRTYVLIQLPIIWFAGILGVWLFYVQHQFEGVYWARDETWDRIKASLEGASYYKLPTVLQWFTGNIGFHHIHHVRPRIPNYNLARAYRETPSVQKEEPLTLRSSLRSLRLRLYDEEKDKMVGFGGIESAAA